jgi:hypothetical protein
VTAVGRVTINPDWESRIMPAWINFAESRLGPDIADDARKYCPVDTGALKASIRDDMEGLDLIVSATGGGEDGPDGAGGNLYVSIRPGKVSERYGTHSGGSDPFHHRGSGRTREVHHVDEGGRSYAAYVELGHRVYHPTTGVTGPEVVRAQPFLRPALFTRRGE